MCIYVYIYIIDYNGMIYYKHINHYNDTLCYDRRSRGSPARGRAGGLRHGAAPGEEDYCYHYY